MGGGGGGMTFLIAAAWDMFGMANSASTVAVVSVTQNYNC